MINPNYRPSQSRETPDDVDTKSSKTTVYLHKNIKHYKVKEDPDDEQSKEVDMYSYDEAKLTYPEYNQYLAEQENDQAHLDIQLGVAEAAEAADENNTTALLALGELGDVVDSNNNDACEAIAELCETLLAQIGDLQARIEALEAKNA